VLKDKKVVLELEVNKVQKDKKVFKVFLEL